MISENIVKLKYRPLRQNPAGPEVIFADSSRLEVTLIDSEKISPARQDSPQKCLICAENRPKYIFFSIVGQVLPGQN